MRRLIMLVIATMTLLPTSVSHGGWAHCGSNDMEIDADLDGDPDVYHVSWGGGGHWYLEANGFARLQRGDGPDPCDETGGDIAPDIFLF